MYDQITAPPEGEGTLEGYPQIYRTYVPPNPNPRLCSNPACRKNLDKCVPDQVESTPIGPKHHIEFCSVACSSVLYLYKELEYSRISGEENIRAIFKECNVPSVLPIPEYIRLRYYWFPATGERGRVRDIYYPIAKDAYVHINCDEM